MGAAVAGEEIIVTPGEILGNASETIAGNGAYLGPNGRNNHASLTGFLRFLPPPPDSVDKARLAASLLLQGLHFLVFVIFSPSLITLFDAPAIQRSTVEVVAHKARGAVPEPGAVIIARVTKVMARMASADIVCVQSKAVKEKFTGIIRQQDVRATEIDKVDMYQSFRPGDIVRAVVLSLGDARAYYLSTAKNELGVVSAQSTAGAAMVPISWTEMQCPLTGQVEKRKVAKIE